MLNEKFIISKIQLKVSPNLFYLRNKLTEAKATY